MIALKAQNIQAIYAGTLMKYLRAYEITNINPAMAMTYPDDQTHQELRIMGSEDARCFLGRSLLISVPRKHADTVVVMYLNELVNSLEVQELNALFHELNAPPDKIR